MEARTRRYGEAFAVGRVPAPQLNVTWVLQGGNIGGEEVHLLGQPPSDNRIAAIKPQCRRFARENLLAYLLIDQRLKLRGDRRPAALRGPRRNNAAQVVLRLDQICTCT